VVNNTAALPTVGQEYTQQKQPSSFIIILRSFSLSFVRRTLPFDIIHHHAFQKQTFVLNKHLT